ncbi:MAG: hypothetical protein HC881_08685 [Leptolyngbyaceae cyanobacterium SL_7_1]|nr:hypothetical protein [Leptolyngbyaceae cyanobacterium SL_7_1]
MPFVILCFVLFFGVAQIYPMLQTMGLSIPSVLLAGLLLAIASNYNKPAGLPWRSQLDAKEPNSSKQTASPSQASSGAIASKPVPAQSAPSPQLPTPPHLPEFDLKPRPSISFTIRKANQRRQA